MQCNFCWIKSFFFPNKINNSLASKKGNFTTNTTDIVRKKYPLSFIYINNSVWKYGSWLAATCMYKLLHKRCNRQAIHTHSQRAEHPRLQDLQISIVDNGISLSISHSFIIQSPKPPTTTCIYTLYSDFDNRQQHSPNQQHLIEETCFIVF